MLVKPLRTKDKTTDALVEIISILEKASEHQVKYIQADCIRKKSKKMNIGN